MRRLSPEVLTTLQRENKDYIDGIHITVDSTAQPPTYWREKMKSQIWVLITGITLTITITSATAGTILPEFFYNPETGEPAVVIVVGNKAASMDVVAATMLASAIGALTSESGEPFAPLKISHQNIGLLFNNTELLKIGFPTVDVPDPVLYWEWEHNPTLITYPLSLWYFEDTNSFWSNTDGRFQPWETHEEIQVRFDLSSHTTSSDSACLYGEDFTLYKIDDLWYTVPGLIYRIDNIFAPPTVQVERGNILPQHFLIRQDLEPYCVFFIPEPWMIILERLPQFKLFHNIYTVVDAGPVLDINLTTGEKSSLHGTPYIITGTPHFETAFLYLNEPAEFGEYSVEVLEVDVDHNKAFMGVSLEGKVIDSFQITADPYLCDGFPPQWPPVVTEEKYGFSPIVRGLPFSSYDTWNDLDEDGEVDPTEFTNIITYDCNTDGVPDFNKWVVYHGEKKLWVDATWFIYQDDQSVYWLLFNSVDIAIDGIKVFIGAGGIVGVQVIVYWLEDRTCWYNRLCSDPWAENPQRYCIVLDSYETGWDSTADVYQPPGTGLWPPYGHTTWVNYVGNTFIGNGFLDCNDGHTGYEYYQSSNTLFFESNDLDRDSNTTSDCRTSDNIMIQCTNGFDIEDPIVWHSPGHPLLEMNICLYTICAPDESPWSVPVRTPNGSPYFTVEVFNVFFKDSMDYETVLTSDTEPITLDTTALLTSDTEMTAWKSSDRNLILIGGPVANSIVSALVEDGLSAFNWTTSPGQWEFISAPYNSFDVLIIAGKDREATRAAVLSLIEQHL